MAIAVPVFANVEALLAAAVDEFTRRVSRAPERGTFDVVLGLDALAEPLYDRLAQRRSIPWHRVRFVLAAEQRLPPEDPRTRYAAAYRGLFSRANVPPGNYWRFWSEAPDPALAADYYGVMLQRVFGWSATERPRFDLALLELGAAGEVASHFPDDTTPEGPELATCHRSPVDGTEGFRLTARTLAGARATLLLASGSRVAAALREACRGNSVAERVAPPRRSTRWLADAAAAMLLSHDAGPSRGVA